MAIIKDKNRNQFYINYKLKLPDGTWKNINIKNKEWKIEGAGKVGLRWMQSIEQSEIEKDKDKRLVNAEEDQEEDSIPLKELIELFYPVMKSQGIDEETIYNYSLAFKKYLFPIVSENTPCNKAFKMVNIDKFRINLFNCNLAKKTINNKMIAVKKLLVFAKKRKYISRDLADNAIDILEPLKEGKRKTREDNFFQNGEEDLRKFIDSFKDKDQEWRVPILTMFYAALRIGEWQAIKRSDCDFENCTIFIHNQIDNHGRLKNSTKNKEEREVRIPTQFMKELKFFVEKRHINANEFIFTGARGAHVGRRYIRDMINEHIEIAGLSHLTPHGLRHSFATRMFDKGYDIKEVQMQLGHSSMETTMKYYIHYTKSKQKKNLDDLL